MKCLSMINSPRMCCHTAMCMTEVNQRVEIFRLLFLKSIENSHIPMVWIKKKLNNKSLLQYPMCMFRLMRLSIMWMRYMLCYMLYVICHICYGDFSPRKYSDRYLRVFIRPRPTPWVGWVIVCWLSGFSHNYYHVKGVDLCHFQMTLAKAEFDQTICFIGLCCHTRLRVRLRVKCTKKYML